MDLATVEQLMELAGGEHPSKFDVTLETPEGNSRVKDAIKRGMPKDWQQGAAAIVDGTFTTWVLLRSKCNPRRRPANANVIIHGTDRWGIRSVNHAYGGLAYQCACILLQ